MPYSLLKVTRKWNTVTKIIKWIFETNEWDFQLINSIKHNILLSIRMSNRHLSTTKALCKQTFFFFYVAPSIALCTHWTGNTHLYPRGATLLRWRCHYSIRPVDGTAGPTTIPCSHPCRYASGTAKDHPGRYESPIHSKSGSRSAMAGHNFNL